MDYIDILIGALAGISITVIYFNFIVKGQWEEDYQDSIDLGIVRSGIDLVQKGNEIEKTNSKKSRDELIDSVSK